MSTGQNSFHCMILPPTLKFTLPTYRLILVPVEAHSPEAKGEHVHILQLFLPFSGSYMFLVTKAAFDSKKVERELPLRSTGEEACPFIAPELRGLGSGTVVGTFTGPHPNLVKKHLLRLHPPGFSPAHPYDIRGSEPPGLLPRCLQEKYQQPERSLSNLEQTASAAWAEGRK